MRTDGLSEVAKVMISAIDDKIAEYRSKINEYNDLIGKLEIEKRKYSSSPYESLQTSIHTHKSVFEDTATMSKKDRIVAGIKRTQGIFDTEQLLSIINGDGGPEISKENFAPTFSRLKGEYYERLEDKDGRGQYKRLV